MIILPLFVAKLTGRILAWQNGDGIPKLPSPEESLPCGPINFQFKLTDPFKVFTSSNLSYFWRFGDGKARAGSSKLVHKYNKTGWEQVVLKVYGYVRGKKYNGVILKNISIRGKLG